MTSVAPLERVGELVPGDPDALTQLGTWLRTYAQGATVAAEQLHRLDTGGWAGPAGDAFRAALGEVPVKLVRGVRSFELAAAALQSHAQVLERAQAVARTAIETQRAAEEASARWREHDAAAGPEVGIDPGETGRAEARRLVLGARAQVRASARHTAHQLHQAAEGAPDEPGLLSRGLAAVGSFAHGLWEGGRGLAEQAEHLQPSWAVTHPGQWWDEQVGEAQGLWGAAHHPLAFAAAAVDLETWRSDPARAFGRLLPTLVLAVATDGGGLAGKAAAGARDTAGGARAYAQERLALRDDAGSVDVGPAVRATRRLTSSIKHDALLVRAAREAGRNERVQREMDHLQAMLAEGNLSPGLGTKALPGTGLSYARGERGGRLFFRMQDGVVVVVAKADKGNEATVITRLRRLYGRP